MNQFIFNSEGKPETETKVSILDQQEKKGKSSGKPFLGRAPSHLGRSKTKLGRAASRVESSLRMVRNPVTQVTDDDFG